MFERYTERARRTLFFARYEASQLGSVSIETEHLLLGLLRGAQGLSGRLFASARISYEPVRKEVESRSIFREKVSTSVEIPFTGETKRVLGFAAEEADRLRHNYIGTEHLLLGLLREEQGVGGSILKDKGMRLNTVREDIVRLLNEKNPAGTMDESDLPHRRSTAPRFVPSRTVHIAYSRAWPDTGPRVTSDESGWGAYHFSLRQIVAYAWGVDVSGVRLDSPREHDESSHYDFMISLPQGENEGAIPELLRDAIQGQLDVDVARESGEPPIIVITPR